MKPGRNDPCWCPSGRKYKHCHLAIDEARPEDQYRAAQDVYSRNWTLTAEALFEQGVYHWMSELLLPLKPQRVFDVGCGSGHGIRAMYEVLGAELQVLSVDENSACLDV